MSSLWWTQFQAAVQNVGYDTWCESYHITHQESIEGDSFTLRKLVHDFGERVRKETDQRPRQIANGAFPTFAQQQEEQQPEPQRKGKRKRRNTDGKSSNCPACDGPHALEDCRAARLEIRPTHRRASRAAEILAKERIEKDPDLQR